MPTVAAWVDSLREVFGADEINRQIRAGMKGEPVFHASENGFEVGTKERPPAPEKIVSAAEMVLSKPEEKKSHERSGRNGGRNR